MADDNVDLELEEEPEIDPALLSMSDDELMKLDFSEFSAKAGLPAVADDSAVVPAVVPKADALDKDDDDDAKPPVVPGEDDAAAAASAAAPAAKLDAEGKAVVEPADVKDPKAEADKTPVEPAPVDHKAQLDKLFAPFKANGKDMNVDNVDDAISLMQMGANYTKKMAALKPNLKLMKLLENNGLLSEEKLSYLIDLDKKNPAAIGKLLKDSGIDPLDVDVDKQGEYKPNTYTVDDRELALDAVLDEVQGTPTYGKLLEVVSNKWDAPSKQVIADNPQLLKVINSHMANGMYDIIGNEIERERTFGRLAGLSDLEAYRQVGDALDAKGAFAQLASKPAAVVPAEKVVVTPKAKPDDTARNDKKRAASPTQAAPAKATDPDFNPLNLSDAEFAKFAATKFQ